MKHLAFDLLKQSFVVWRIPFMHKPEIAPFLAAEVERPFLVMLSARRIGDRIAIHPRGRCDFARRAENFVPLTIVQFLDQFLRALGRGKELNHKLHAPVGRDEMKVIVGRNAAIVMDAHAVWEFERSDVVVDEFVVLVCNHGVSSVLNLVHPLYPLPLVEICHNA